MPDTRMFGRYRATVKRVLDPTGQGRIQFVLPTLGPRARWAEPCFPITASSPRVLVLPKVGATVWVEFEGGDPDFPIWVGHCWDHSEAPAPEPEHRPVADSPIVLRTAGGAGFTISDMPGGIRIANGAGAEITLGPEGVTITNGSGATIRLVGPTVSINHGALDIT